jgi:molecular chaperone DnaJ
MKTLSVKIPPGVDSGDRIRLAGEGEVGRNGGPPGDLYVEINVRPHPIFERQGADLACEIPVSFSTLVLGGSVDVPTLDGEVSLKIPEESQTGRVFRLRGKGVKPVRGGMTGDLMVRVTAETPVKLNKQQRELLRKFEDSLQSSSVSHSPREHSWLDGVKAFFEKLGSAARD